MTRLAGHPIAVGNPGKARFICSPRSCNGGASQKWTEKVSISPLGIELLAERLRAVPPRRPPGRPNLGAGERLFLTSLTIEPVSTTVFSGGAVAHAFAAHHGPGQHIRWDA